VRVDEIVADHLQAVDSQFFLSCGQKNLAAERDLKRMEEANIQHLPFSNEENPLGNRVYSLARTGMSHLSNVYQM
jgi:hypothetical protein